MSLPVGIGTTDNFPKGTDLEAYSQEQLDPTAAELNGSPGAARATEVDPQAAVERELHMVSDCVSGSSEHRRPRRSPASRWSRPRKGP